MVPDAVGLLLEGKTALGLYLLERGEIGEADIGQWLIGERPEVLGRLQFGGVGGQDEEMDALGHLHLIPGMPARSIEDEEDPFLQPCSHIPSKGSQHLAEENGFDGGEEPPLRLTGGGTDEATDIEPFVALLHRSNRSLPDRCPDSADKREESDPMLIGGPELDLGSRMVGSDGVYLVAELS